MNPVLGWLSGNPVAAVFGVLGFACLTGWPLLRGRQGILGAQLGAALGFAVHHAFSADGVGAILGLLAALLTATALPLAQWPRLRAFYLCVAAGGVAASLLAWRGLTLPLALAGLGFLMVAQMQSDAGRLRALGLAAAACACAVGFVEGSLSLFAGNLLAIGIGLEQPAFDRHEPPLGGARPAL